MNTIPATIIHEKKEVMPANLDAGTHAGDEAAAYMAACDGDTEIRRNRRAYITALRRSKRQCAGELFSPIGACVCAIGVGVRRLTDVKAYRQYEAANVAGVRDLYAEFSAKVGIVWDTHYLGPDVPVTAVKIYKWNDRECLSFNEIADRLEKVWFPRD